MNFRRLKARTSSWVSLETASNMRCAPPRASKMAAATRTIGQVRRRIVGLDRVDLVRAFGQLDR